ncbi:radical SAM protein [Cohnella lubricantis]|uniref:Radical SAM protein n=1 Tax=Cohnella lubricantis TaxID=2163172 RepID=A0A841THC5_9BACL|nr:radical SAM protein [Cohnella lubricantis]MBB6678648.1 radical SAM protein [Cohnella lubricantis]MBP2119192.1 DNA repair photolyase [Cohnella lubricantis]
MPPTAYEPMGAKSILNAVKAPSMPFDWSINPYRGCQHGCAFCYARSTHAFLGEAADDTFQHHIFWKDKAPDILRAQLKRMSKRLPRYVAIGTATDPYQQLEGKAKLTRGCLEVLAEFGIAASVTTRSPLVLRDLDLLRRMPGSSVNISIHSLDQDIWRTFEPSSPSPKLRIDCAAKLGDAGVPAIVFMAPILPFLTDKPEKTEELISACAQAGVRELMPSFLRLSTPEVKSWFFSVLRQSYPQLADRYGQLYWRTSRLPDHYRKPVHRRIAEQMSHYGLSRSVGAYLADRGTLDTAASGAFFAASPVQPMNAAVSASDCAPVQLTLF